MIRALYAAGYDAKPSSPEELQALMRKEYDIWGKIVKAAKVEKE